MRARPARAGQATPLSGSIAPGRYYLVQLASTAAVGAPLPAPDATGTTNLAASGGKVALVQDATRTRVRCLRRELRRLVLDPRSRRLRRRGRLRGLGRRARALEHDRRAARRSRLHRHRRQRLRLHVGRAATAQFGGRGVGLCGRPASSQRRRVAGGAGRRRRAVAALDQPRACEPQLRAGAHGHDAVATLRGAHRLRQRRRRILDRRPSFGVCAGRPATRDRLERPGRRAARSRARGRRARRGPGRAGCRSRRRDDVEAERSRRRRVAGDARVHDERCRRSRRAGTPPPSRSRCSAGDRSGRARRARPGCTRPRGGRSQGTGVPRDRRVAGARRRERARPHDDPRRQSRTGSRRRRRCTFWLRARRPRPAAGAQRARRRRPGWLSGRATSPSPPVPGGRCRCRSSGREPCGRATMPSSSC